MASSTIPSCPSTSSCASLYVVVKYTIPGNIVIPGVDLSSATSSGKKLVTSGDITDFVTASTSGNVLGAKYARLTVLREFDIEYILRGDRGHSYAAFAHRTTVSKGRYGVSDTSDPDYPHVYIGAIMLPIDPVDFAENPNYTEFFAIHCDVNGNVEVFSTDNYIQFKICYNETVPDNTAYYRLYA